MPSPEVDRVGSVFRGLVDSAALQLPLPGGGDTARRWAALAAVGRVDPAVARLAEAHTDALAILTELGGPTPPAGSRWGVWAAEPPQPVVAARRDGAGWVLDGVKPWCSGAHVCTHALLTVRAGADRPLVAADLTGPGVHPVPDTWPAVGMAGSDSGHVAFDGVPAIQVGDTGSYAARPGFWHGAIGVAACWYGGACGVADRLVERARSGRTDPHLLAHLGAVDAALGAAGAVLDASAAQIDADPLDEAGAGRVRAMRVRALVEAVATEVLDRVGRATGAGPLGGDAVHARRVADLTVYLRQSHAEVDLAQLGTAIADGAETSW